MSVTINDLVVYVVTSSKGHPNTRVKGILSLNGSLGEMIHVTRTGLHNQDSNIVVGAYPNPLGLLRIMGLNKIKSTIERYIYFPSPAIMYVWKATKVLKKRIKNDLLKRRRVCLITCVPHHDIAFVGLYLKSTFPEINWVVDWQDFWSYDEYYYNRIPSFYKKRLLDLEKRIFLNCDTNVTTNLKAKTLVENYYNVPPHRVISINHHFYRPELNEIKARKKPSPILKEDRRINIGFLGNLFKLPKMPGPRVVEAFNSIIESGLNIKLHIFGDQSHHARQAAAQSRNGSIIIHPRTSHKESMNNIAECDFLLLAMFELPNCQVVMNIKLPHYLLLGKTILAMVPEKSAVADITRETGSGYVIPSTSCWRDELKKILQNYLDGGKPPERNEKEIEKYSWKNISKEWIKVITGE